MFLIKIIRKNVNYISCSYYIYFITFSNILKTDYLPRNAMADNQLTNIDTETGSTDISLPAKKNRFVLFPLDFRSFAAYNIPIETESSNATTKTK